MLATKEFLTAAVLCALFCVCGLECPASAQPVRVEARQVCRAERAVNQRGRAWSAKECSSAAAAFNETPEPMRLTAMAANESNMRPRALRVTIRPDGLVAYDVGLLQVRCLVNPARKDTVCLNGPAKGLTVKRLLGLPTNIRTAWAVYEMHGRDPGRFNGATGQRAKRYRQRITALEAALMGLPFVAPDKRTRGLCKQIVEAMGKEPRS